MSYSRLQLYNDALLLCQERSLANLTENREPRYLLDQVWDNNGVQTCLEEANWYFAMRSVQLDPDPSVSPPFGYPYAYSKPTDWLLTDNVASDEFFRMPLTRYVDEAGYWYTDIAILYVRYVSNDAGYGQNMALWPQSFVEFAAAHFADKVVRKLSTSAELVKEIIDLRKKRLLIAKSKSARAEPTKFPAPGTWSMSRQRGNNRRDRGNTSGNLY